MEIKEYGLRMVKRDFVFLKKEKKKRKRDFVQTF